MENNMAERKLRAGVVGLGVGKAHIEGYLTSPDADLVALCDMNEERLKQAAEKYHTTENFTDYQKMFAEAQLDIVSICLPNALHAEASIAALEAGLNVICEKPMTVTVAEAQRMVDAAKRCNRRLMVSYNYRYRADTQWMRDMVQSGKLGTIYHANVSWRREIGIPGWGVFGNKALSGGGSLIDLGVHVLDLGLWMMGFPAVKTVSGDVRSVFGKRGLKTWRAANAQLPPFEVEDGGIAFMRLANGANMFLQATWAEHTEPKEDAIRVELQGSEGTAILHIRNYDIQDTLRYYTEIEGQPMSITPSVRFAEIRNHQALVHDLTASVRAGTPPATSGEQGLVAVTVLQAIYESAESGHEISL
jgi:predicted dehydrogenase